LLALLVRLRQPHYNPDEPLRLACAVARNKGIDALRQRRHPLRGVGLLPDAAADSELLERLDSVERRELRGLLNELFGQLPPRQALIARLFLLHCDDFGPRDTYDRLTHIVAAVTGRCETVTAVKSAWHAARTVLATELRRRGYAPCEEKS
jgi:DNA-directed RNA polymerase specialized sigma24 family protein